MRRGRVQKTPRCCVVGCGIATRRGQDLCHDHWRLLPQDLRAAIMAAGRDALCGARARGAALKWYANPVNRGRAEIARDRPARAAGLPYRED